MRIDAVLIRNGEIVKTFYSLIRPEPDYYKWFCQQVHGLGHEDTDDADVFPYVWRRIDDPEFVFHDTLAASRKHFCGTLENHHHALADAEACAWIARVILAHEITDLLIQYGRID